jgi:hypothetical protein
MRVRTTAGRRGSGTKKKRLVGCLVRISNSKMAGPAGPSMRSVCGDLPFVARGDGETARRRDKRVRKEGGSGCVPARQVYIVESVYTIASARYCIASLYCN